MMCVVSSSSSSVCEQLGRVLHDWVCVVTAPLCLACRIRDKGLPWRQLGRISERGFFYFHAVEIADTIIPLSERLAKHRICSCHFFFFLVKITFFFLLSRTLFVVALRPLLFAYVRRFMAVVWESWRTRLCSFQSTGERTPEGAATEVEVTTPQRGAPNGKGC